MKKLVYVYENGNEVTHTKYISDKSIKKKQEILKELKYTNATN